MGQMRNELDVNANGRYQVGENGTLQLMNVRVTDAGMYSCEVSNEFGNDTRMQTLLIIIGKSVIITYCVCVHYYTCLDTSPRFTQDMVCEEPRLTIHAVLLSESSLI